MAEILTKSQYVARFHKEGRRGTMRAEKAASIIGVSRSLVVKYDQIMKRLPYTSRVLILEKLCKGQLEITQYYDHIRK